MKNEQLVPASAFVVMVTGVLASVQKTSAMPGANFWIGIAIAYTIIALLAEIWPDMASGLALLVLVAALLGNGEVIAQYTGIKTGGKIGTQPRPPRRSGARVTVNNERIV